VVLAILLAPCLAGRLQLAMHNGKEVCLVHSNSFHGRTRRLSLVEEALAAAVMAEATVEASTVEAADRHHHQVQVEAVGAHHHHQVDHSGKILGCLFQANAGLLLQLGRHMPARPSESSYGSCKVGTLSLECPCAREGSQSL
jgi:hypothetical protein